MTVHIEATIGSGKTAVGVFSENGRHGLALCKLRKSYPIGENISDADIKENLTGDDIVIWLDNIEGARVLQDAIATAILGIRKKITVKKWKFENKWTIVEDDK